MIMKKHITIVMVSIVVYLSVYSGLRYFGYVGNVNYYFNNYHTNSYVIMVVATPGCVLENLVFYTWAFGWRGPLIAFSDLRFNRSDCAFMGSDNHILWWSRKYG